MAELGSPFAVPEDRRHRRHLRHRFYLLHPELDQREPRDRDLDAAYYDMGVAADVARTATREAQAARVVLDGDDPLDVYGVVDALISACRVFGGEVGYPERLPVRARLGDPAPGGAADYAVLDAEPVRGPDGRPYLRLRLGAAPPEGAGP